MEELLNQISEYQVLIPLFVFFIILVDSVPFAGLILPEEILLITAVIFAESPQIVIFIFIASVCAMLIGQTAVYLLSKRYTEKVSEYFHIPKQFVAKVKKFEEQASFFDHILLRLSSTSLFRITAAFVTGLNQVSFRKHITYEVTASILKSAIFVTLGVLLGVNSSDADIEFIASRIGLAIFIFTLISLAFSFVIKKKLNNVIQ